MINPIRKYRVYLISLSIAIGYVKLKYKKQVNDKWATL